MCVTHEQFIHKVTKLVLSRLNAKERKLIEATKLVYGAGPSGTRGITYYDRWKSNGKGSAPFVEICAFTQEGWIQVAGTTIHELAHVLCGMGVGHTKTWKDMCERLGLLNARAAGHEYILESFDKKMCAGLKKLKKPDEGEPVANLSAGGLTLTLRTCGAGTGTRGGKSRGKGSGGRMKLYHCGCEPVVKVRHAGERFSASCNHCGCDFEKQD